MRKENVKIMVTWYTRHLEHCHAKKREMAERNKENSSLDSFTTDPQPSVSQFSATKKKMTSSWLNKLKNIEAKFVLADNV